MSLSMIGFFYWYGRATRDAGRLLDRQLELWSCMAMLVPGIFLIVPYVIAQAKLVARVEVATARSMTSGGFVLVCVLSFVIPWLVPLVLQPRLNRAATAARPAA